MPEIYTTQPIPHRSDVTSVDAADPVGVSGAVDAKGYQECRFDVNISSNNFSSLEVQALFWNPRQQLWWGGARRTFYSAGQHALVVECRGAIIFLKVTAFIGSTFSLAADYILS